jgi:4,5-DOPA dioxygenase extradiol
VVRRGDLDELSNFRKAAPGMPYAHPTTEHFTPIFVALGAVDITVAGSQCSAAG